MLPLSLRLDLRHTKDFFSKARTRHSPNFFILFTPNPKAVFAVVVAKKQIARAVDRSKIKRRVRAVLSSIPKNAAGNIVIFPKKNSLTLSASQIKQEIAQLLGIRT